MVCRQIVCRLVIVVSQQISVAILSPTSRSSSPEVICDLDFRRVVLIAQLDTGAEMTRLLTFGFGNEQAL